MKIVHCADLHLDSKMTANLTKEQARERKKEILRTFTRMVEYAAKNGVRAILIAGDLFDTRNISAMARNTVRDMICTHPEIDFLYLRGNHDSDNFLSKMEEPSAFWRGVDGVPLRKCGDHRNGIKRKKSGDGIQFTCAGT